MNFQTLFARLTSPAVSASAVRSEIYFLGGRHQGEALKGALAELKAPDLGPGRSRLLRAVVSQLKRDQRAVVATPAG
jgi:hypothetical protein